MENTESFTVEVRKKQGDFMVGIKTSEQHLSSESMDTIKKICESRSKDESKEIISKIKRFYCNKCEDILGKDISKGIRGLLMHYAMHNYEKPQSNYQVEEKNIAAAKLEQPRPPPIPFDRSSLNQDVATFREALESEGPLQYVQYNSYVENEFIYEKIYL